MRLFSHKGLSIFELLAVLVILGILSAVAVVSLSSLLENTRIRADQANVVSLNQATRIFSMSDERNFDIWLAVPSIESKIDALVTYGYLSRPLRVQHPDSSYDFNDEFLLWCFVRCQPIVSDFNFITPNFSVQDFAVKRTDNSFTLTPDGLYATPPSSLDNILFFPNPRSAYIIEVTAQIFPRQSGHVWGGFGVLVETRLNNLDPQRDFGYIVQLDRHEGQVIVRRRNDGNEVNNILLRYNVQFDQGQPYYVESSQRNDVVRANPWWEEPHTMRLEVNDEQTHKTLSVWIDDVFVFTWTIPEPLSFEDASLNHTGLRVWNDVPVLFTSFEIRD